MEDRFDSAAMTGTTRPISSSAAMAREPGRVFSRDDIPEHYLPNTSDTLRKYFPRSYTPQRMQETIIKLLEQWQRKRQQQHER